MQTPKLILLILIALVTRSHAQITADMEVSQGGSSLGTITIELDHVAAPMATANFIGLASGTLPWIDSTTGVVRYNQPYYDGLTFHRVIDGFMNQGGSQNGLGTDGPGYRFQDGLEINNGLDHTQPYRISMANSGLDSNGSQFFITVEPTPGLDGKHIVFGQIKETGPSRAVVDTINNVAVVDADGPDNIPNTSDDDHRPVTPVVIDTVTVHYNGVDFDPSAQGLPAVTSPALAEAITPETTEIEFDQPINSTFHLAYSDDLTNWTESDTRRLSNKDSTQSSFPIPEGITGASKQFFSPALVTYETDFVMPSSLANQTLTVEFNAAAPIVFVFDATGQTATWSYQAMSGTATIFHPYNPGPYSAYCLLVLPALTERYWQFNSMRPTNETSTEITGTHSLTIYNSDGSHNRNEPDTFILSQ